MAKHNSVYNKLCTLQMDAFPDSMIITQQDMKNMHQFSEIVDKTFHFLEEDTLPFVCYVLPEHSYGSSIGMCCNGIRFGRGGDYISLPHLPSRLVKNTLKGISTLTRKKP